jgi:serine/threonine protein kinase
MTRSVIVERPRGDSGSTAKPGAGRVGRPLVLPASHREGESTAPATPDDVPETSPLHRPASTLDLTDLLQRFVTVCNIAGYAHSRGVIHRVIKPSNVLLGDFGETLLLDWGLARVAGTADFEPVAAAPLKSQISSLNSIAPGSALRPALPGLADEPGPARVSAGAEAAERALQAANSRLTVSGQVPGTPAFASPEQLLGDPSSLTARSDVYSLGATLFRILTGESLVRPDDLPQYLEQLKSGTVSGVVSRLAHVPAALSAICCKALALDPLQRYAAATELARDVERYLRDEPVPVSRESIWRRFLRWLRRHPRLSSSCAAAPAAGFGVALLASVMPGRKNEPLSVAIDEAEAGRTQAINALRSLSDNVLSSVLQQNTRLTRQQTSYLERGASQYSAFAGATGDRPDALLLKAEGLAQCGAIHCARRQMPQAERELSAASEFCSRWTRITWGWMCERVWCLPCWRRRRVIPVSISTTPRAGVCRKRMRCFPDGHWISPNAFHFVEDQPATASSKYCCRRFQPAR